MDMRIPMYNARSGIFVSRIGLEITAHFLHCQRGKNDWPTSYQSSRAEREHQLEQLE